MNFIRQKITQIRKISGNCDFILDCIPKKVFTTFYNQFSNSGNAYIHMENSLYLPTHSVGNIFLVVP